MKLKYLIFLILTSNCCYGSGNIQPTQVRKERMNKASLPPCHACKVLVNSFQAGMDRTSKYKHEGGDAAWEEKKLKDYATSEIRFVEILEKLCSEVTYGKNQCYKLMEEYEERLDEWFKQHQTEPDIHKFICINAAKVCCPENHYGPECDKCVGYPDNVCNNHGKCKGAGTRKGNGKCNCDLGYVGSQCDTCADNHFLTYQDDRNILCSACHQSCDGKCTKAGPDGCQSCKTGWKLYIDKGCVDINECMQDRSPCKKSEFCVNREGNFTCMDCHKSCFGCNGDGPDECIECAAGYEKQDNLCVDANEEGRQNYISYTRYATYLGLCICVVIISNKNIYLAAEIGLLIAVYIGVAEYFNFNTKQNWLGMLLK